MVVARVAHVGFAQKSSGTKPSELDMKMSTILESSHMFVYIAIEGLLTRLHGIDTSWNVEAEIFFNVCIVILELRGAIFTKNIYF